MCCYEMPFKILSTASGVGTSPSAAIWKDKREKSIAGANPGKPCWGGVCPIAAYRRLDKCFSKGVSLWGATSFSSLGNALGHHTELFLCMAASTVYQVVFLHRGDNCFAALRQQILYKYILVVDKNLIRQASCRKEREIFKLKTATENTDFLVLPCMWPDWVYCVPVAAMVEMAPKEGFGRTHRSFEEVCCHGRVKWVWRGQ